MDEFVPICCFCSQVRDDRKAKAGKGPWMDLSIYASRRQLPISHRFIFTHGYCPDCVAHFEERMAAYRRKTVWQSLTEAVRRLIAAADAQLRERSSAVNAVEDVPVRREKASGVAY